MRRSDHPSSYFALLFFFQAEDGIRDPLVTGVQTCALPISPRPMAMSARALSTCFRRLLPEESAGSIGRTAHSCRRIEARGAPAPRRLSLLIALDITLTFSTPGRGRASLSYVTAPRYAAGSGWG